VFVCHIEKKEEKRLVRYTMNTQAHMSRLNNCQFIIPTETCNVGRVKISPQNLVVLASQQVSSG
jgi:hypothetical protein